MSRPTVVYLFMIAVLVAGLWTVLALGAHLSAPEDLSGKWQLHSTVKGLPDDELTIEQSGQFFQLVFAHGSTLDLKLTDQTAGKLVLTGSNSKLQVSGAPGSDDKLLELSGNVVGRWSGHRIVRAFPSDVTTKEGH